MGGASVEREGGGGGGVLATHGHQYHKNLRYNNHDVVMTFMNRHTELW